MGGIWEMCPPACFIPETIKHILMKFGTDTKRCRAKLYLFPSVICYTYFTRSLTPTSLIYLKTDHRKKHLHKEQNRFRYGLKLPFWDVFRYDEYLRKQKEKNFSSSSNVNSFTSVAYTNLNTVCWNLLNF